MTLHFEESIITGTRAMSGSAAIRRRKRDIAASASSMPSSMLTSMICAPFSHLLPGDVERLVVAVLQDQLLELRRAGDVGAFADVDEIAFRA